MKLKVFLRHGPVLDVCVTGKSSKTAKEMVEKLVADMNRWGFLLVGDDDSATCVAATDVVQIKVEA